MRGKGNRHRRRRQAGGITPAYAGKSGLMIWPLILYPDHPRVCGEKCAGTGFLPGVRGSPPRMRGKAEFANAGYAVMGITPAYAGKSATRLYRGSMIWDHPRVCGEKLHAFLYAPCDIGSPPRMRGKEARPRCCRCGSGITPAYAGKSCPSSALANST